MHFFKQLTLYLLGENYLAGEQIHPGGLQNNRTIHESILKPLPLGLSQLSAVSVKSNLAVLPGEWSLESILTPFHSLTSPSLQLLPELETIRSASFIAFDNVLFSIIGPAAALNTIKLFSPPDNTHVHEASVFVPATNELLFADTFVTGWLWAINIETHKSRKIATDPPLPNVNGGTYHCTSSSSSCSIYLTTNGGPAPAIYKCPLASFTSTTPTLSCEAILNNFRGRKLNSPNDLIPTPSGDLIFTDPPYGWTQGWDGVSEPELPNGIYYFNTTSAALIVLSIGVVGMPNGLALSRDGKTLFVADSASISGKPPMTKARTMRGVWAFDIAGTRVSNARVVHVVESGWPDGIRMSENGYLMVAVVGGVDVVDVEKGVLVGKIIVGDDVIYNLEAVRGVEDGMWLLTGAKAVYKVSMKERGFYL